jgi:hypothetical protein
VREYGDAADAGEPASSAAWHSATLAFLLEQVEPDSGWPGQVQRLLTKETTGCGREMTELGFPE